MAGAVLAGLSSWLGSVGRWRFQPLLLRLSFLGLFGGGEVLHQFRRTHRQGGKRGDLLLHLGVIDSLGMKLFVQDPAMPSCFALSASAGRGPKVVRLRKCQVARSGVSVGIVLSFIKEPLGIGKTRRGGKHFVPTHLESYWRLVCVERPYVHINPFGREKLRFENRQPFLPVTLPNGGELSIPALRQASLRLSLRSIRSCCRIGPSAVGR